MSKQKNNISDLLAAIQRQPTSSDSAKPVPQAQPSSPIEKSSAPKRPKAKPPAVEEKSKSRMGKPKQFWMHDEDEKLIRELSAWLAGQGIRTTDSLIIRAVLRFAKTGSGLLEAHKEAASLDGRIKRE